MSPLKWGVAGAIIAVIAGGGWVGATFLFGVTYLAATLELFHLPKNAVKGTFKIIKFAYKYRPEDEEEGFFLNDE